MTIQSNLFINYLKGIIFKYRVHPLSLPDILFNFNREFVLLVFYEK